MVSTSSGAPKWSEDYFICISGMGLIIKQNSTNLQKRQLPIQEQLKYPFEQDWNPKYYINLEDEHGQKDSDVN
uniref:Uncharacterized protein n=1 Tax=Calidris pygmaea TaxID=425635 RepID=A0A8C3PTN5_9CHAR